MAATANFEGSTPTTKVAGATVAARRMVKLDSTEGQAIHGAAITDVAIGASISAAASGELFDVQGNGVALVEATAAAISIGAQVMIGDTAGRVATAAGATAKSVGVAETAAGGTLGEVVAVRLNLPNVNGPANS